MASSINPSSNFVLAFIANPIAITPVGIKHKTAKAPTHRQSWIRRGAFGLYFWRLLTVFTVLALDTAEVAVLIVAVLVYSGFVGLICGYSKIVK